MTITKREYGLDGAFTDATRADLEDAMWGGEFTPMFGEDLIELLVEHPDIWIILDTKWDHVLIAETLVAMTSDTTVLDRIVPHLTSAEHTTALESVYPFPERLLAVYQWRADDRRLQRNPVRSPLTPTLSPVGRESFGVAC